MWRPFQINSRPVQTLLRPWLPDQEEIVRAQTGIPKASVITINPVTTVPAKVETWPLSQAMATSPVTTVPATVETSKASVSNHHSPNHGRDLATVPYSVSVASHYGSIDMATVPCQVAIPSHHGFIHSEDKITVSCSVATSHHSNFAVSDICHPSGRKIASSKVGKGSVVYRPG